MYKKLRIYYETKEKNTKLVKSQQNYCWDSTLPTHCVRSTFPIKPTSLICMWYKSSKLESFPQYDLDICTHAFLASVDARCGRQAPEQGEWPAQVLGPAAEPEHGRRQIVQVSVRLYLNSSQSTLGDAMGRGRLASKTEDCVIFSSQNLIML